MVFHGSTCGRLRAEASVLALLGTAMAIPTVAWSQVLFETNASDRAGHQGEVSIAVNRYAPASAVAASMDLEDGRILVMATDDAGESWQRTQIPISARASFHADPMVTFDSRGDVYLAHIPVTSSNDPIGIEVSRSVDGGLTWSPSMRISSNFDQDDKVVVHADDERESPYRDYVYVAWKFPSGGVFFSRSVDRGASFTPPRQLDSAVVTGLDIATNRRGVVFLAVYDRPNASVRIYRSVDGGENFGPSIRVASTHGGWWTEPPSHCRRMSIIHASIATNLAPGGNDDVYVTWSDYAVGADPSSCGDTCALTSPCQTDVFFSKSMDQGLTWTRPIPVHETDLGRTDQYFQWLETDPRDGALYVAYKDTRAAPSRHGTDTFLNRSTDCGLSWERSRRLSSASSFASTSDFQYGDYQGVAASDGQIYAVWTDYRPSSTGAVSPSEIFVGRATYADAPDAWGGVLMDSMLELRYRHSFLDETPADVYVALSDASGARSYLGPTGRSSEPTPYATVTLRPNGRVRFEVPVSALEPEHLLTAFLAPAVAAPDPREEALSPELRAWTDDIIAGGRLGCFAESRDQSGASF